MRKLRKKRLLICLGILLAVLAVPIVINYFGTSYTSLNKTDQAIIGEIDTYFKKNKEENIWEGYHLEDKWAGGSRFSKELSEQDLELLKQEYVLLTDIQTELSKEKLSKAQLLQYAKEYAKLMRARIAGNTDYLKAELSMETAKGTAQYIGIKASEMVGYDYGVMYFDNMKDVPFSETNILLEKEGINKSFLANRMPYETGALLCLLLDELEVKCWKEKLNEQTLYHPVTLCSILLEYVEKNGL